MVLRWICSFLADQSRRKGGRWIEFESRESREEGANNDSVVRVERESGESEREREWREGQEPRVIERESERGSE